MQETVKQALIAMAEQKSHRHWVWGEHATTYSDWKQVDGDVTASIWGATFGRIVTTTDSRSGETTRGVELVKIYNWETDSGEDWTDAENGPYHTETYDLTPWSMGESERKQYLEYLEELSGMMLRDDDGQEAIDAGLIALAIHIGEYGYFSEAMTTHNTLGAAMSASQIPAEALTQPAQATVEVQWGPECHYVTLERQYPRTNHLAALAREVMSRADSGDDTAALVKHMETIAWKIDDNGDTVPAWYKDNPAPCEAWRTVESF